MGFVWMCSGVVSIPDSCSSSGHLYRCFRLVQLPWFPLSVLQQGRNLLIKKGILEGYTINVIKNGVMQSDVLNPQRHKL